MSSKFFGYFAILWWGILIATEFFPPKGADHSYEHYAGVMAMLTLGIWSIIRKIDGKQPL